MQDETTPQDAKAMPPASTGSVADEPAAWMHVSGGLSLGVFKHVDPRLRHLCVPLYRQPSPTLTAEERELLPFISKTCRGRGWRDWSDVIDGLLQRLGGEE